MDATQMINDSILESDEEENEEENESKRGRPLAKLCILTNEHIPETELPLFLGENVLGRDPNTCTLPLPAPSISKRHATICISVYRRRGCHSEVDMEALVWDHGSMNGTRKGRLKLTPNVRYALSDGDSLVVADIPCQYVRYAIDTVSSQGDMRTPVSRNSGVKASLPGASGEKGGDINTGSKKCVNGGAKARVSSTKTPVRASCLSFEQTPTQPQGTLVPESDSDSDGERRGGGDRRHKALVSDSDSHKSSPTCSTFLSPTNKIVPESSLHLDSDTDDEAIPAPALGEPSLVSAATESRAAKDGGADTLPDSDTDVEDDSPLVEPVAVATLSVPPGAVSDSDADTDVDESSMPPAGDGANPPDLRVDSDTDVEDKEADVGEAGEGQIPGLRREETPGIVTPLLQNCSTPVQLSEGQVENMETQAFLSPSSVPFRCAVAPVALSSCSDSQEDEDFVVAETQSFILQTRGCQSNPPEDHTMDPTQAFGLEPSGDENDEQSSRGGSFQLGLSDSSHLQCQAQALAMESTQAFVSTDRSVNLEDTQAYAAISTADRTSAENDSNLEATQAYGADEEPARCSVLKEENQSHCTLKRSRHNPFLVLSYQLLKLSPLLQVKMRKVMMGTRCQALEKEKQSNYKSKKRRHKRSQTLSSLLSKLSQWIQPMGAHEDEQSEEEDFIPGPRKGKAKPLQIEDEETQPLTIETQPVVTGEDEESDDEDSIPASGRLRAASQAYKVLFTGVVDEAGERVLARLGGSMAKGVADMNCLVTDKVRRTVKFLCAVAKGVPIVTTHWLGKSGKAGSFLSPNAFLVKDSEQEKKFSFCLQESLRIAGSQPLLQGYEIHVTKSVKPEPVQMKDIISCSGATFLPKMPSSHKPQTVVISCEEDWSLCSPAVSASLPVVTAEFILTGILQQKVDFRTHALSAPVTNLQPAGGRGRGRKKT
ncbi:mediator of DNA damage checkpoint protein 1 [Lates japonicus]|uniref:Mediator of DNA damage checkpoint protein 1 n=1 Tax=Lates japonicus TaxID=270547 RepID=A0AAD3MXZ2_LATJO|nr:mediator of DNA damage checkpoint protein 1 [Lates japonicus]